MMVSHWLSWWGSGFFFWSIIALLFYVNFCCTMKCINDTYRKWQPTPVFLPGESQGQGSLVGCSPWGRTESDTTEAT